MKQHIRTHRTHSEDGSVDKEGELSADWSAGRPVDQESVGQEQLAVNKSQTDRNSFHSVTGIASSNSLGGQA